jgi:hypothetical protein
LAGGVNAKESIQKEIVEGNSSCFKTPQRAGTCYYRCVHSALHYLCMSKKCVGLLLSLPKDSFFLGLTRLQYKQLAYAIRVAYLHYADLQLDVLGELYELKAKERKEKEEGKKSEDTVAKDEPPVQVNTEVDPSDGKEKETEEKTMEEKGSTVRRFTSSFIQ